jgi:homoserine kinase type II
MAVYTRIDRNEVDNFLREYDIGTRTHFSGITAGVENTNYRLTTTKGLYILTLYEKRVNTDDLPFFTDLMTHMATSDITCPKPVADKGGEVLKKLNGRQAALFTFLDGKSTPTPSQNRCYAAGKILAKMHRAGENFNHHRNNTLGHAAWKPLLEKSRHGTIDRKFARPIQEAETWLDSILSAWPENLPRGIIHADLFPDNMMFIGNEVTAVIDFYFACHDILAYDLAIMINAWCFDRYDRFNINKSRQLIAGYQSIRRLNREEKDAIPTLCKGAAMRFFLTRLYDWRNTSTDAQVRRHDPMEYWTRLEFHHSTNIMSDYGISDS